MYGAARPARNAYAWMTAFPGFSPYPASPPWMLRPQVKTDGTKFLPAFPQTRPWGEADYTALIQAGASLTSQIATTAITENAKVEAAKAAAKKKKKKKNTMKTAEFQSSLPETMPVDDGSSPWPWVGVGAAALVVVAVVLMRKPKAPAGKV